VDGSIRCIIPASEGNYRPFEIFETFLAYNVMF
jgi:hypothetical protein